MTSEAAPTPRPLIGDWREILRFIVSGSTGSAAFALLYLGIHELWLVPHRWNEAFAWSVAYLVTTLLTHRLHRTLTFRWHSPYWRSLRRAYVIYGTSLAVTTGLHDQLVHEVGLYHWTSFAIALPLSGCANYLAFRHWGFVPDPRR